jgi:hypothetical protein
METIEPKIEDIEIPYRFVNGKWHQPYHCILCKTVQMASPILSNIQFCEECKGLTFAIFDIVPEKI